MNIALTAKRPASPLMLADRLLTLAQDADSAGYQDAASRLVELVYAVLDQQASSYAVIADSGRLRPIGEPAGEPGQFRRSDSPVPCACQPQA